MFVKYLLFLALSDNENVFCKIVKNLTKKIGLIPLKIHIKTFAGFFLSRLIFKSDPVTLSHISD